MAMSIPAVPPAPARRVKAPSKILATAPGRFSLWTQRAPREAAKKISVIMGTSFSASCPAAFSPPLATRKTSAPTAGAVHRTGSPRSPHAAPSAFTCTIFPMAREDMEHPRAYIPARIPPSFPAFSMYERGPGGPLSPCRSFAAKKFSAYTVVIPSTAEAHIQNMAPGPPTVMAAATPTMFPVPMDPARAVAMARKRPLPRSLPDPRAALSQRRGWKSWKKQPS